MIRYAVTKQDLEAEIDKESPTWRRRAGRRAKKINAAKAYDEATQIWSEIKNVYRRLQNHKCAFCERALAGEPHGAIEHDIEHFRPKSEVAEWACDDVDKSWHTAGCTSGYYWLAYDLFNYATSCKTCNSPLKANYFPIAGKAGNEADTIDALNTTEMPLLIYPISDKDVDPEKLIRFNGITAVAIAQDSHSHRRAFVTIGFFRLNSRDELQRERAAVIKLVWDALEKLERANLSLEQRQQARDDLDAYMSCGHQHASCARSFVRMYEDDPVKAYSHYRMARQAYNELVCGRRKPSP